MTDLLDVWVGGKRVGELIREDYEYSFQYQDLQLLDPARDLVSLTMPVRAKRYDTQVLMPPFQMALPEGALLENIRVQFGKILDTANDMVLLRLIGNNTIGRVQFAEPGQTPKRVLVDESSLADLLTHPETEALFAELFEKLAMHSGVSGVQPKILWSEGGKKAAIVSEHYLIKAAGPDYPLLALNEYFCLTAAREAGLPTPDFQLAETGEVLAVRRFDINGSGYQLAFEEFCALLGRPAHGKYTGSYEELADAVRKVPCEPTTGAMRDLFKSVALSLILQNGDAHLKNFGILYDDIHRKWLAPTYDIVTTSIYLPRDVPALTIDGKKAWPDLPTLEQFGLHACGLRKREVNRCLAEVRNGLQALRKLIESSTPRSANAEKLHQHLLVLTTA